MNEILDLLRSRRTVHRYRPEPVAEGLLERALEAAVAAPNHRLTEPWRFLRVGPETRAALFEVYVDLAVRKDEADPESVRAALQPKFMNPAILLVVSRIRDDDHVVAREDYAAVACAIQNLMLSLHADGVASKWTTGAVTRDDRTYDLLGVNFDRERIEGFVWIGHADHHEKPHRRLSPADLLRVLP